FTSFSGHTTYNNARLLPSGEVDTTFSRSFSTADQNDEIALTLEGKILIPITIIQTQADTTLNALYRLLENGELDTTFEPGITGHANAIRLLPDGRFYLAGQALGVDGRPRGSLFRFYADGSLDTTFSFWGRETVPIIYALTAQRDGRPVFSGSDGSSSLLAACMSTGVEDTTFQFFLDDVVIRLAIDSSDAVLASGGFSSLGGVDHGGVARIDATGTIDTSFKVALSPCYAVPDFATDALGRTLLFGYSPTLCAGSMWSGILRLLPDCTPQPWYADLDGDGAGDPATLVSACAAPPQHVANDGDCDDSNPLVQGPLTWYADVDGDGFGNPASSTQNCSDVPGHVLDNTDCDDSDPLRAPGVACDDGQDLTTADAYDATCVCKGTAVRVAARAFLQGPYTGGGMNGALRSNGLLPVAEPYTALGMNPDPQVYGGDHLDLIVGSGPNAFIDWVMLELRSAANPQQLVYVRMCMLQNDGDIVETQPIGPVRFPVPPGDYYLVLKHRNHLGVMTATPLPVVADGVVHIVDFTQPGTACFGTNARVNSGGTMLLWAGNVNGGNQISY
ncbi:MAG: delta-60 repeat domain-containing protein, partial [Flavobacteriales bacterium]|nr:delta-60 repeat domain-containing protein [Flavobacteriales bacterium]